MKRFFRPFSALKHSDFKFLALGSFTSWVGSQMQIVAIIWHVYQLTNSPYSLAIIGFARFIPLIIVSPLAGVIADKFNRKKIILVAQAISMLSAIVLTYLTFANLITPMLIYILLIINSTGSALESPARHSMIPSLVPKESLINALSLNSVMFQVSMVAGPSLAGFLIGSIDIGWVYLINSLSFIAVIVALFFIKSELKSYHSTTSFSFKSLKEGFIFVFTHPLIASTMLLDFFATFFSSATVLLPIFAKEILSVGPQGLGLLYAAPSLGAIAAGLIFSSFKDLKGQGKILLGAVTFYGLATVLFGVSKNFNWSFFFLALAGAGDAVSAIIRNTIRQLATPDYMRGRMTSVNMIFYMGGPQLGEVEAGFLAGLIGLRQSVVIGGAATILLTIVTYALVPKLRQYQDHEVKLT